MERLFTFACTFFLICLGLTGHAQTGAKHILLTEVTLSPNNAEFIEIANTTNAAVDLSNYYLADNMEYPETPAGTYTPGNGDFIVKFPSGTMINAGQVIVVGMRGIHFDSVFTKFPDFEIVNTDPNVVDMVALKVDANPTLTNAGEGIVLFYWDGTSDLVKDVDLFNAGKPSNINVITSKTNLKIDGPDPDTIATQFFTDANTLSVFPSSPPTNTSLKRFLQEGSYEVHGGGNGLFGDDETTENTLITWDTSYLAPNPGMIDFSTSISIIEAEDHIVCFPNPSNGTFYLAGRFIELNSCQVKITDLSGHTILEQNLDNHYMHALQLEAPGMYLIQILNAEFQKVIPILIR